VQEESVLIIDNATLIDLETGDLRPGQFVTIDGDSIVAVEERRPASNAAERIDLAGRCLLPGLIDAHFHATLTDTNPANLRDVADGGARRHTPARGDGKFL
jgi:imidazolonepropionase-like amidohydrolase